MTAPGWSRPIRKYEPPLTAGSVTLQGNATRSCTLDQPRPSVRSGRLPSSTSSLTDTSRATGWSPAMCWSRRARFGVANNTFGRVGVRGHEGVVAGRASGETIGPTLRFVSAAGEQGGHELVVADDGSIPAEQLARFGLRPGTHLRVVETGPVKPGPKLAGSLPDFPELSWEDFERGSELARRDLTST
jgi:hypothetical protein